MKTTLIIIAALLILATLVGWNMFKASAQYTAAMAPVDFYSLRATTLDGDDFSFEQLRGKRILIVNTASECGFTPQYAELQKLHEQFSGIDFMILGFPCNDFGKQEKVDSEKIGAFCQKNFGVSFQMMEKVSIKGDTHSVYQWLTKAAQNGVKDHNIIWNFHKFTVSENGELVGSYRSAVSPLDNSIISFVNTKNK
jgi:glutathione peroxidase